MSEMIRFANDNLAQKFLTEEEIKKVCPLAFVETPTNEKVSDKYVLANTATVIADMKKMGWEVVEAKQRKAHKDGSGRFSYHMVVFQNPLLKITKQVGEGEETIDCYPRIILTNSHDGLNCFKFMVGLFRLVCSNGLVIAGDQMVDLKIRHIYYNFEELRDVVVKAIEMVAERITRMTRATEVLLTEDQKREFARKALCIRKNITVDELKVDDETLTDILTPQRDEDKGNSLWNVFNVLQEKIIKGGYFESPEEGKKARKVRKVTSFVKDLEINQKLWRGMEEYIPYEEVAA